MSHEMTKDRAGIKRQIKLPNSEAIKIAYNSIRIRLWRSFVTMAGIILAIAFLTFVMISATVDKHAGVEQSAAHFARQIWLISISLMVCCVGIINAMLMSVTERYREIGTMKCLGALDWFVIKLFLIEACFLGIIGSLLGMLIGLLAALLTGMTGRANVISLSFWGDYGGEVLLKIVLALVVGGVLSVLGAIYPARRAGKMPPADAMRTEV